MLGLLAAPPLLLGLLNLVLATPWGRARVAAQITQRCGLEASLGHASWTPWSGVFLGELRLLQPPPLRDTLDRPVLELRGLRVFPQWKPLLKGHLRVAEIRIERPRGAIALEMLASIAGKLSPPHEGPPLASAAPEAPPTAVPDPHGAPEPPAAGKPPPVATSSPAVPVSAPVTAKEPPAGAWLELSDADCDFYLSGQKLAGFAGFKGRIPIGGPQASGNLSVAAVEALEQEMGANLALPVAWAGPALRVGPGEVELAGIRAQVEMVLGRLPGIPFEADIRTEKQPLDLSRAIRELSPKAAEFAAGARIRGLLLAPGSWQGIAATEMKELAMKPAVQTLEFHDASASVSLQGGILNCPDARMIGDSVSLLGNGSLRGGELAAVLRMVVLPEVAQTWQQRLIPAGAVVPPVFHTMDTPARLYIDLRWVSYPGGRGIEFGEGGPVLKPGQALQVFAGAQ
ncbi:hypothetical protein [Haloferula sp. BvORR071]|uniref:hypothetical protein n=1 Tax=Haloferula sp. BvORR071 TaxID=1396141 RepID=UPI000696B33A|nr:hypothetical protein [Haloferula sp. BvORR071]